MTIYDIHTPCDMRNGFLDEILQSEQKNAEFLSGHEKQAWDFELQRLIEKSFKGVKCVREKNVLLGSAAQDDVYARSSQAIMNDLQKREERKDWSKIPPALLLACEEGICHMGAEALRFILPAYMILSLKFNIQDHRVQLWLYSISGIYLRASEKAIAYYSQRFEFFTENQKQAVQMWFSKQRKIQQEDCSFSEKNVPFLPWEYADFLANGNGSSPFEFLKINP